MGVFHLQWRIIMLDVMTVRRSAGEKIAVNARIDAALIDKLKELAAREGTVHYERSLSELIGFAVREYVDKHGKSKPDKSR